MKSVIKIILLTCTLISLASAQSTRPRAAIYITGNLRDRAELKMLLEEHIINIGEHNPVNVAAIESAAVNQTGDVSMSDAEIAQLGKEADAGIRFIYVVEYVDNRIRYREIDVEEEVARVTREADVSAGDAAAAFGRMFESATYLRVDGSETEVERLIGRDGGRGTFTVETDGGSYNVDIPDSLLPWVSLMENRTDTSFRMHIQPNTEDARGGSFYVTADSLLVRVNIIQRGVTRLTVNDKADDAVSFNHAGGRQVIQVYTNEDDYDITDLPAWCVLDDRSPESFVLTCEENLDTASRVAVVSVSAGDKSVPVSITQRGRTVLTINGEMANVAVFGYMGGVDTFSVYTNEDVYSVIADLPDGCVIEELDGIFVLSCDRNRDRDGRSGKVTVTAGDESITVSLSQEYQQLRAKMGVTAGSAIARANIAGDYFLQVGVAYIHPFTRNVSLVAEANYWGGEDYRVIYPENGGHLAFSGVNIPLLAQFSTDNARKFSAFAEVGGSVDWLTDGHDVSFFNFGLVGGVGAALNLGRFRLCVLGRASFGHEYNVLTFATRVLF